MLDRALVLDEKQVGQREFIENVNSRDVKILVDDYCMRLLGFMAAAKFLKNNFDISTGPCEFKISFN